MPSQNGWKVWVISILGAILLSFGGLTAKNHLDSVDEVRKKAESAYTDQVVTKEKVGQIKEQVDEIKSDVKEIKKILQENRRSK